jgi:ribosomal protein S18 acetylase RimI-like enzyme
MSSHPLDQPAFAALTSRHQHLAETAGGALRYQPDIIPFAVPDAGDTGALARLVKPGETTVILQAERIETPNGFSEVLRDRVVQLVAEGPPPPLPDDPRVIRLSADDAPEMLDLAMATKPGPFTLRALDLGAFWGVRQNGRLVAMAGVRMSMPGFTEVSGVCAAPEARGQGMARLLSLKVMRLIAEAGDVPFLHAWTTNAAAIGLYQSIGFTHRAELHVAMLKRNAEA